MQCDFSELKGKSGTFLLGFSGGVDSSALFFLLLENQILFDVGIVDYGLRKQSKEEVAYAKRLAKQYNKKIHLLSPSPITRNFEAQARQVRYEFFESIIQKEGYCGLILAHQFNDVLEWFLMQMCKGAGLNTLLGHQSFWGEIEIFRPLLEVSKDELYEFCHRRGIVYFEDEHNRDKRFLRTEFRKILSPLIKRHYQGLHQSLEYLKKERQTLYSNGEFKGLCDIISFARGENFLNLHHLDQSLKRQGYVLSKLQRDEILRNHFSCEIAWFVIECDEKKIFLTRKQESFYIDPRFKDWLRRHQIPKRLRPKIFFHWKNGRITKQDICEFFGLM